MTPDELIARYQGWYEVAEAKFKALPAEHDTLEWLRLFTATNAARDQLHAAKLMLAVCRSHGL